MEIDVKKIVLQHLECELKSDMSDFDTCDVQCYSESTADGYEVYVLKYTQDEVNVCENIYYYDHDLAAHIMEHITDPYVSSVYIDECLAEDVYLDDALEEYFTDNVSDIVEYSPDVFTKEELQYVKRDYLDVFDED